MHQVFKKIFAELIEISAIDTHEHLRFGHMIEFSTLRDSVTAFDTGLREMLFGSYMDIVLKGAARGAGLGSLDERKSLLKALQLCSNTSSYRCGVEIPLRDLYGFDVRTLDEETWDALEEEVSLRYKDGPWVWCQEVFRQANIEKALKINVSPSYYDEILPSFTADNRKIEEDLFVGVGSVDFFILQKPDRDEDGAIQQSYDAFAAKYGISLDDVQGFVALIDKVIADYKRLGACAVKSSAAYERSLRIEFVPVEEADRLYRKGNEAMSDEERQRFSDFAWIEVARSAVRHDLPFIIHTGAIPGRGGLLLSECNPALMKGLVNNPDLSETKFVLIHTGYPYARETVHMAWDLPNVWVDFVWLPTLSIEASVQVLGEFLDWVPANKFIMGGDFELPEGVYGAMYQCREVLAMVLARKVKWGIWSAKQAIEIGQRVLRDNALELFRL